MNELAPAISSFVGILVGSGLLALYMRGREDRVRVLESEVVKLRENTVKDISAKVDRHVEGDKSQGFAAKLETVISQNNEIMLELKQLSRESASQATTIARTEKSLGNLWDKFDACRQNHGGKHA